MADLTAQVRKPALAGQAPNYVAVSASDTFTAAPDASYVIHYKNGATSSGAAIFAAKDQATPAPTGAALAAGWADAQLFASTLAASGEWIARIDNTNRFRDSTGKITLTHSGTLTTVTAAILGPYPAGG